MVTAECDSSRVTNISLWYSYTQSHIQEFGRYIKNQTSLQCQSFLFLLINCHSHKMYVEIMYDIYTNWLILSL